VGKGGGTASPREKPIVRRAHAVLVLQLATHVRVGTAHEKLCRAV